MNECADIWIFERYVLTDKWMNVHCTCGYMNEWMYVRIDEWIIVCTDRWMDEFMYG